MIGIWQDLRHTVRTLVRSPGFSAVILGILILGIGINAAIFSIANAVLLKPLPYIQDPDQLVDVFTGVPENPYSTVSYLDYLDYRNQTNVLSDVISDQITQLNLSGGGPTESISGEVVSGNYFSVLGVKSELGRVLLPGDDQAPGTNPVAVIGYTLWQRDFGSDQNVIGRQITLNDHSFTVIGVTPQGFFGKDLGYLREIWIPLSMSEQVTPGVPWLSERGIKWLSVQGRLKPGMSINQARANMATVVSQLAQAYPTTNEGRIVSVAPLNKMGISPDGQKLFRGTVMLAMVIVGLILLIACANVGGLLLARGAERRKEIAIRLAIGASRGRLVQQLLTESIVLALVGGGLGVLIARWSTTLLIAFDLPYINSRTVDAGVDWRVLGFTLLISILSGVFFGLLPALQTTRPNLVSALKESLSAGRTDRLDLRKLLVIFQIAVSLVLLIVAGLFVKSLHLPKIRD
jgi:macrolide transport system ATP-binding/permease protein